MAALTSTSSALAGTAPAPVAVAASDTIAAAQFGPTGVDLRVINAGGSPDTVTIVDPTLTVMGSAATNPTATVTNATTKVIFIPLSAINQATQVATVNHSFTTSVTCEAWKR
jgi:hypothetical protein